MSSCRQGAINPSRRLPAIAAAARHLAAVLLLLAASGCMDARPGGAESASADRSAGVTAFQRQLDRLDVPYRVPPEGKAILVNIPAFELIAFTDGMPVLRSRVIVGTPWHPTPLLETYTAAVRFRPTWRPTPAMVRSGKYDDRVWPPGRRNPLGLAAIRLEPGLLVYLHDTNRRDLFRRERRALSHGCIRVERWDEVIAWLLDIGLDEVRRIANGRRTLDVATPPVPVRIGYFTRFPDPAGAPVDYPDIYRRSAGAADGPAAEGFAVGEAARVPNCGAGDPAG